MIYFIRTLTYCLYVGTLNMDPHRMLTKLAMRGRKIVEWNPLFDAKFVPKTKK